MKKTWLTYFIFSVITIYAKDGFRVIKTEVNSVTIEYTLGGVNKIPVTINGKVYQTIYAEDCVPVLKPGFPQVLRASASIAIPTNAIATLEIISTDFIEVENESIAPSKGSLKRNVNEKTLPYTFAGVYNQNSFYPSQPIAINSTYFLRQQKGTSFSVFPVQTNPAANKTRIIQKIIFKISYVSLKNEKINFNTTAFTSNEEKQMLQSRFLNLPFIQSAAKVQYTPVSEFGDMLIISDPALLNSIQPLADWKNQKGIKTELVSSVTSGTNYAQVQTFIQNYYSMHPNLLYVLFVGDHEQINAYPAGMADQEVKWSDAYYGLLTGNDHYPEIMIGRFSSALASDITTMVNRTLEYEKNPTPGNWFTSAIGIGSNEGCGIGDEGEADWQHMRKIGNKLISSGYTFFREFYDSTHAGSDAPGDPTAAMVSGAVNTGASLFLYCGHGDQNVCVTSNYTSTDITASTNNGRYPFSIQVACNNGTFINGTCLSETFLRAKNANGPTGAIASAGSSILMSWAEPMDTQDEIGDIVSNQYPNNKKYTLGGLFYNGQMHMLDDYPTQDGEDLMETWILFGDPSCVLRSANPITIAVSHNDCFLNGATSFSFTSSYGVNTFASISQNNQVIGTTLITSSNTTLAFTQPYNSNQNLLLTITEYNKIPYTTTLVNCLNLGVRESVANTEFFVESPVKEELNFNYKNSPVNTFALEVLDLQGKVILYSAFETINQPAGNLKMNTSTLSPGIYLLKISDHAGVVLKTIKLLKE